MDTKGTILVVDDNAANLQTIEALLAVGGYTLLPACNGTEALEILERSTVDLVLLDVMMPDLNGYEVCQRIRANERTADLPVVMVTALDDRESRLRGIEVGADDFISKPFDRDELRTRVRSILRLNRYRKIITHAERAEFLEHYDPVTGLPNRLLLGKRLALEIETRGSGGHLAVLCIGLQDVDTLAETLGTEFAEQLLKDTAKRLNRAIAPTDTLGRLGDYKFTIITPFNGGIEELSSFAQKLISGLNEPYSIGRHTVRPSTNVGISLYPGDSTDGSEQLTQSAAAMTRAGAAGGGVRFFTADMNAAAIQRLQLESDLRQALDENQLSVHYQPKVDLTSGNMSGVEALLRWQHPDHGMILPSLFIPVAEQIGLIGELGEWVLRQACQQMSTWLASDMPRVKMAVNVSSQQFRAPNFAQLVERVLADTGLPAEMLDLELTESLLMPDSEGHIKPTMDMLQQLKDLGISISIDDFGTGYSSLSYLTRFPIDTLKIDQSFIFDMFDSINNATITKSIIDLARNLRLTVVAEGVEDEGQKEFLRSWQCSEAQGYLFCEPLPAEGLERIVANNSGNFHPEHAVCVAIAS